MLLSTILMTILLVSGADGTAKYHEEIRNENALGRYRGNDRRQNGACHISRKH